MNNTFFFHQRSNGCFKCHEISEKIALGFQVNVKDKLNPEKNSAVEIFRDKPSHILCNVMCMG